MPHPTSIIASGRVLILESETISATLLRAIVEELGCTCAGIAHDIPQALAIVASTSRADVAILDYYLSGGSSGVVAGALLRRNIPFVISSQGGDMFAKAFYPGVPFLRKPYARREVDRTLLLALERARGGQSGSGRIASVGGLIRA
jgi:CheY-like chemotaxis protein